MIAATQRAFFAESGRTGDLTHAGDIRLNDTEVVVDRGLDEALDQLTNESGKTGILVGTEGGAAFNGDVTASLGSEIFIVGQDSFGIRVASELNGDFVSNGAVNITGERSAAVSIEGPVNGDVVIGQNSQINVRGAQSEGVVIGGDVDGSVRLGGTIRVNGFRINERTVESIYDLLERDPGEVQEDERLSGSAVVIAGSIRDGVFFTGTSSENNTNAVSINATGSAPAVRIQPGQSSTGDITLGEVTFEIADPDPDAEEGDTITIDRPFGFVNDGNITADGVFDGVNSTALLIAGRDASGTIHAVILAGDGMENTGTVTATAFDADAHAVHLGVGARMASFTNSGTINATSARGLEDDPFAADAFNQGRAIGVLVDADAEVDSISNSGNILAILSAGGQQATAIRIASNQLTDITNTGVIRSNGVNLADDATPRLIAIDASGTSAGLTVTQSQDPAEDSADPSITGEILFGSGADTLDIQAGTVTGDVDFGSGADSLIMRNATLSGAINSGDGQLTIDMEDSTLELGLTEQVNITSARLGEGSVLNLVLGQNTASAASLIASDTISFEQGSELVVSLSELVGQNQTYRVLSAGTLSIADDAVVLDAIDTPFIYEATLERDGADPNSLVLSLERKTAEQIGFDPNRAAVYDAAVTLFDDVSSLGNAIASIRDQDAFYRAYDQLLPEYAASAIQFALASHDAATGAVSTRLRNARLSPSELAGMWIQEFGFYADRTGSSLGPGYRGYGVGAAVGIDRPIGPFYAVGVSLAGAASEIEQIGLDHDPMTTLMGQLSGYAAMNLGGIDASFTASAGINRFETERRIGIGSYSGSTSADWNGWHYSLSAQAGRDIPLGSWVLRPEASLTYLSISEDGFNELALDNTAPELALFRGQPHHVGPDRRRKPHGQPQVRPDR